MSNKQRSVKEFKIIEGHSKPTEVYTTPIKVNKTLEVTFREGIVDHSTPSKINNSSNSSCSSFESATSEADNTIISEAETTVQNKSISNSDSTMATNEELTRQLKELMEQFNSLAASVAPAPVHTPVVPLSKAPTEVDFGSTKNSIGMFPQNFANSSHQNAKDHMSSFVRWCEASGITRDSAKVQWFGFSILGDVTQWYEQTDFFSFDDLRSKFDLNFGKYRSKEDARVAFNNITLEPLERASDYYRRIQNLATTAGMTKDDEKDQFFRGLGTRYVCVKQVRNLYSLDQAVSYLQNVIDYSEKPSVTFESEVVNATQQDSSRRSRSSNRNSNGKNHKNNKHSSRNSSRSSRNSSNSTSRSRSRSGSRKQRSSTPYNDVCYNCGGKGHYANDCSSKPRSNSKGKRNNSKSRNSNGRKQQRSNNVQEQSFSVQSTAAPIEQDLAIGSTPIPPSGLNGTYRKTMDIYGRVVMVQIPEPKLDLN